MSFQPPLFSMAETPWVPPPVSSLPSWPEHGEVDIDVETRDDFLTTLGPGVRRGAYIVGISFAIVGVGAWYLPLRHDGGDNVPNPEQAIAYVRDNAARFLGKLGGGNLQYDLDFLEEAGIVFPNVAEIRDVQVADPLIYELHRSYSVESIAQRRGLGGKREQTLREMAAAWGVDPKKELWRLPARHVHVYAEGDVEIIDSIRKSQKVDIEAQNLHQILELESRLLPVLLKMRRRGIRIDQNQLQKVDEFAIKACAESLAEVRRLTGVSLTMDDMADSGAKARVLRAAGHEAGKTAAGKDSVDQDLLEKIDQPFARSLERACRMHKLKHTYVAQVTKHMVRGRVHATFNQLRGSNALGMGEQELGAAFGRCSACDPSMQNQPSKDEEIGRMWREIYLPDEGRIWVSADFKQQEPRVLTHYAELSSRAKGNKFSDKAKRQAREFGDKYRNDPKFDTYRGLAEMTKLTRDAVKIPYLGVTYNMGQASMCHLLKLPTVWEPDKYGTMRERAGVEGAAILKSFSDGASFIKALDYFIRDRVQEVGVVRTLKGRVIHFPKLDPPRKNPFNGREEKYDWANTGLNRIVQGGSGDQTKQAMVDLDKAGFFLQLQVHDETDGSVNDEAEAQRWGEVQRDAIKLTVPMAIDVETGPSWGGSMKK